MGSQAVQVVHCKLSEKMAEVRPACGASTDNGSSAMQPVDSARCCWQWGLIVLADGEAGDELMSVPRDSALIASGRDELVLAVMEVVQQIRAGTTADEARSRGWQHVIAICSARPGLRLLAGCFDPVMDVLKGESTGTSDLAPQHTVSPCHCWPQADAVMTHRITALHRNLIRAQGYRRGSGHAEWPWRLPGCPVGPSANPVRSPRRGVRAATGASVARHQHAGTLRHRIRGGR